VIFRIEAGCNGPVSGKGFGWKNGDQIFGFVPFWMNLSKFGVSFRSRYSFMKPSMETRRTGLVDFSGFTSELHWTVNRKKRKEMINKYDARIIRLIDEF